CSFLYGTKGLQLFGPSISSLSTGNMVSGCQFFNQYFNFAHIKNQRDVIFKNNSARTNSAFSPAQNQIAAGYYFESCNFFSQIIGNSISTVSTFPRYGIYLFECNGTSIQKGNIGNNLISVGQSFSSDE